MLAVLNDVADEKVVLKNGYKRVSGRFSTGRVSGWLICGLSVGSKCWMDSAKVLMRNFGRCCLIMPLFTPRMPSVLRSK